MDEYVNLPRKFDGDDSSSSSSSCSLLDLGSSSTSSSSSVTSTRPLKFLIDRPTSKVAATIRLHQDYCELRHSSVANLNLYETVVDDSEEYDGEEHIYESVPDLGSQDNNGSQVGSDCGRSGAVFASSMSDTGVWNACQARSTKRTVRRNGSFFKVASESNIEDALVMMTPGLRRIPKDTNYTTEEEEEEEEAEDNFFDYGYDDEEDTYMDLRSWQTNADCMQDPDSGFSSCHCPPNASWRGEVGSSFVTVIRVNDDCDDGSRGTNASSTCFLSEKSTKAWVTVNGHKWE